MIDPSIHNAENGPGDAFALSIDCDPPIVEPGQYITIAITDPRTVDALPTLPLRVVIMSHANCFQISHDMPLAGRDHAPYSARLLIDASFPLGRYDVHVSATSIDTTLIGTFQIAPIGFRDTVEKVRSLLTMQSDVSILYKRGDQDEAATMLGVVAASYSRIECFTLAATCYRDLASMSIRAGRPEDATVAIRHGLFQALLAALQRSAPDQTTPGMRPDSPSRLSLSHIRLANWEVDDLLELASSLDENVDTLTRAWVCAMSEGDNYCDYVHPVVDTLAYLEEREPLFLSILKDSLIDARYCLVCIRALSVLDVETAVELLPDVCVVACRLADPDRDALLRDALRNFAPRNIYPLLSVLLTSLTEEQQPVFLSALFDIVPADCLVADEELFFYTLHDHTNPITVLPNRANIIQPLLPFITIGRFSDFQRSVRALSV